MNNTAEFQAWPKIPRSVLSSVYITEKMDGTNACIIIEDGVVTGIQSRKRMITPGKDTDNYGFAGWVERNMEIVLQLGNGRHYGEWAGLGINGNNHNLDEKVFYLFNTRIWNIDHQPPAPFKVVRVIDVCEYSKDIVEQIMMDLLEYAKEHNYKPEGIVVYFPRLDLREKVTFEYNKGKWNDK